MDPPPEGCPTCGSTWGDVWRDVDGKLEFFCCEICAIQWTTLLSEVRIRTGWPRVDRVELAGNRWGRTGLARFDQQTYRFFIAFTPEGRLRKFKDLSTEAAVPPPAAPPTSAGTVRIAAAPPPVPVAAPPAEPDLPPAEPEILPAEPEVPPAEEGDVAEALGESPVAAVSSGLHPALRERIDDESARFPNLLEIPEEEGRKVVRQMVNETDDLAGAAPAVGMLKNSSFSMGDHRVSVRVFAPTEGDPPCPVVVYYHGGGWVFGDLDTHDSVCREIAERSHCTVVSVAYRRSPEHKFPDALEDAYGAVKWVAEPETSTRLMIDPERIAVAGDSVGGNLAAVVCRLARERGGPKITQQVLICPVTAYEPDNASYRENAKGYGLDVEFMPWMWSRYLRTPEDAKSPLVAPLLANDLAGLPGALIITAEFDPLRDEGEEYGERLASASVDVQVTRYPGMVHGFLDYRGIVDEGWDALDEIGARLRSVFHR